MGCPTSITDSTDVLNIAFWGAFTICVHIIGVYMVWNKKWYTYLHAKTIAPPEKVLTTALFALALANAYGAWRVWYCNNWDTSTGATVLAVYFFMHIFHTLFVPSVMLSLSAVLSIVLALIASGLSIAYTVLAFIVAHDTWVGLIGVANIIINLAMLIFAIQAQISPDIYSSYKSEKEKIRPRYQKKALTPESEVAKQSAIGAHMKGHEMKHRKPPAFSSSSSPKMVGEPIPMSV